MWKGSSTGVAWASSRLVVIMEPVRASIANTSTTSRQARRALGQPEPQGLLGSVLVPRRS